MLDWIAQNWISVLVFIPVAAAFLAIVIKAVMNWQQGKMGCSCAVGGGCAGSCAGNCAGCSSCAGCHAQETR